MSGGLRVIAVMPEAPDPFGNPAARWYSVLLAGLAARGHDVRAFAAFTREAYADAARRYLADSSVCLRLFPYPERRGRWRRKWATLRRPYSYFIHPALGAGVTQARSEGYDVLHLEQLWSGYLGLGAPRAMVSVHHLTYLDLAGTRPASPRALLDKVLMAHTERRLLGAFHRIRATTRRLAGEIGRRNPRARISTVPIAVDPRLYPVGAREDDGRTVGFIGSMHWGIGRSAACRLLTRVWPRVHARRPDARLLVAGWAAAEVFGAYDGTQGVTILGDIEDPRRDFFQRVSVFAYPLEQGSGMKVKVLEALASGIPVVGTPEGLEGVIDEQQGEVMVAEDDEAIAERVLALLADDGERRRLGLAGRRLVEERFSPEATIPRIERVLGDVAASRA